MALTQSIHFNRYKASDAFVRDRLPEDGLTEWLEVTGTKTRVAFGIDPSGALLETVEFADGLPDWEQAGEVNPALANDPGLCAYVAELLNTTIDEVVA